MTLPNLISLGRLLAVPLIVWLLLVEEWTAAFGLFVLRISQGRNPFDADRNHFHHHFVHAGIPVGHSTVMILINTIEIQI